ncbi:MAG: immune inhibitor A, partial [Anaerolineaceae bacterium]|nr:immune inhibitor A [Anaerolineaceae bacterium]
MKRKYLLTLLALLTMVVSLAQVSPAVANPPAPGDGVPIVNETDTPIKLNTGKSIDQPNMLEVMKLRARDLLLKQGNLVAAQELMNTTDRVLVILVEFSGSDSFTWTPGVSTWDPIGQAVPTTDGTVVQGNCSVVPGIPTTEKVFNYGPTLHNTIPQPVSAVDRSGDTIWTPDFSPNWFKDFMFGNGVVMDYSRVDASKVHEDFTGKSVTKFYEDMSGGKYHVTGDVIGWLQLNHSAWWYGADPCPGARSGPAGGFPHNGAIPNAGSARSLVKDAVDAVDAIKDTIPGFSWANYDQNADGVIDRLWIVHAGYGEEDSTTLTNRTDYGEAAMWSHSSALSPSYPIGTSGMKAGAYIMMPENGGIGVFAHEYGHNLGADDLYSYAGGETSAGFWTTMADDWTGYPIGFQPPAMDPMHLDRWGWLDPTVIKDPSKEYIVTVGQASEFPGGDGVSRGVKIELPDGKAPLPVGPAHGNYMWYGGGKSLMNSMMTLKTPLAIPTEGATLNFNIAHGIETEWDFLWVQASKDGGNHWLTLSNPAIQSCIHDPGWVGGLNGFPTDLCAANIYGFTDYNPSFPGYDPASFTLSAADFGGQNVLLRFWYMTDWGTQYEGAYVDDVKVLPLVSGVKPADSPTPLFSDDAESGDANWTYSEEWIRSDGSKPFPQNYYLQYRNTGADGGYDSGLGDPRFRYGPANEGLLVWYNNGFYNDNEIINYLNDYPGFGPKGMMLVVDAHPEPYRDPYWVSQGYPNEAANLDSRGSMRDAPYSLNATYNFWANPPYTYAPTFFAGPAPISFFDDSLSYYPGAEFQPGGPVGQTTKRWMTKMWDTSVVIPSTEFYGIKAPGYNGTDRMRFGCSLNTALQVLCYSYASGLGY